MRARFAPYKTGYGVLFWPVSACYNRSCNIIFWEHFIITGSNLWHPRTWPAFCKFSCNRFSVKVLIQMQPVKDSCFWKGRLPLTGYVNIKWTKTFDITGCMSPHMWRVSHRMCGVDKRGVVNMILLRCSFWLQKWINQLSGSRYPGVVPWWWLATFRPLLNRETLLDHVLRLLVNQVLLWIKVLVIEL